MDRKVVGLFYSAWNKDIEGWRSSRHLLELYRYAVWFKANPRSKDYMCTLFTERFPAAMLFDLNEDPAWRDYVRCADIVVLLYPDAIGLGFATLEHEVRRLLKPLAALRVLSGRRREFVMNSSTSRALIVRRVLERSMLLELLFTPIFVCLTPLLLMIDLLRGRR